ncbi:Ent-cassadiene C11-alpha-hydroxylase 1 [Euphorbia peplus]|nr:Ent-cassadiene C11-alpha-hydroxylase 1 [Euphorbia peplus]
MLIIEDKILNSFHLELEEGFVFGLPLAHRVLNFVLGSLLHQFDWKLGSNINPESLDMREILGLAMRKMEPLLVPKKKQY